MMPAGTATRDRLTPKMHRFCLAILEGEPPSEAYRQSYDAANMSADAISTEAQRLLRDRRIRARIDELRITLQTSLGVSRATLLREIDEARDMARASGDVKTMLSTTMAKGKLLGFLDHPGKPSSPSEREAAQAWGLGTDARGE